MQQAADDGIMPGGNYEITQPIVITFGKSTQGFMGFNGNGTNGADVITYQIVNPGIDVRYLVLEKFSILDRGGTGRWQGVQPYLINGYLAGGDILLESCQTEGYGGWGKPKPPR